MGSEPSRDCLTGKGGGRDHRPGAAGPAAPSGRQHHLEAGDQEVTVTEVGATLRVYRVGGVPVLDGFGEDELCRDGRGQLLIPWPGRVGDGRYRFRGEEHQLPLNEVPLGNAIHGLARWASWVAEPLSARRLVMRHHLHPQEGYPFDLDLAVTYELCGAGLEVEIAATNRGRRPAPYGAGAHPYLTVGTPSLDACRLRLPAATRLLSDPRLLPCGRTPVDGTEYDFRKERPIGELRMNTAFSDLVRDADGLARVSLTSPGGRRLVLWMDAGFPWLMVFTGDTHPRLEDRRRSLAVEPMTCPPDAFRSGEDLVALEPGQTVAARWGIDLAGFRVPA